MPSDPSFALHQRHSFLLSFHPNISFYLSFHSSIICFSPLSVSCLLKLSLAEAGWKHSHSDHILHPHPPFFFLSLSSFSRSHIIADLSRVLTLSWWTPSLPPPPTKLPYFPFIPFFHHLSFSHPLLVLFLFNFMYDQVEEGWREMKVANKNSLSFSLIYVFTPSTLLSLNHIYILLTFIYPGKVCFAHMIS